MCVLKTQGFCASFVFMHVIVCARVREVSQAHWRTRGLEPVLIPSRLSLCKQHVNSFELSFSFL